MLIGFDDESDGRCPICGAPNYSCNFLHTGAAPLTITLLPQRDARAAEQRANLPPHPPLLAERLQPTLGPTEFTTGTYKRSKRRR